jgi:hypothetical protein
MEGWDNANSVFNADVKELGCWKVSSPYENKQIYMLRRLRFNEADVGFHANSERFKKRTVCIMTVIHRRKTHWLNRAKLYVPAIRSRLDSIVGWLLCRSPANSGELDATSTTLP